MFINVDLPEPEAPMMATNSPSAISSDTPRSACTSTSPIRYVLTTSSSVMSAVVPGVLRLVTAPPSEEALLLCLRALRLADRVGHQHVAFLYLAAGELDAAAVGDADGHRHLHGAVALQHPDRAAWRPVGGGGGDRAGGRTLPLLFLLLVAVGGGRVGGAGALARGAGQRQQLRGRPEAQRG